MCSSVVSSISTLLCNQSPELFILQNWNSISIKQLLFLSNLSVTTILFPVYKNLTTRYYLSGIIIFFPFCAWFTSFSVTASRFIPAVISARIPSCLRVNNVPLIPHFVYPFVSQWTLGCFLPLTTINNDSMNRGVYLFKIFLSILLSTYPEVEFLDHMVNVF